MTTDVAVRTNGAAPDFSREQIDLIKRTVARDANDQQLELFLYTARSRGLDPLLKQIHAVVRKGEMAIQVGIDGLRLIAARTGDYVGNDEPVFIEGERYPSKASVTVWRMVRGERRAFTDSAYWSEFYPDDASGFMWRKLPHVMLGKVAESRALRKAFPHETSGLYSDDEMHQADRAAVQIAQPAPVIRMPNGQGEALSAERSPSIRMVDPVTAEVSVPAVEAEVVNPPAPVERTVLDPKAALEWIQKLPAAEAYSRSQRHHLGRLIIRLEEEAERFGLVLPARTPDMDPAAWATNAVMSLAERHDDDPF